MTVIVRRPDWGRFGPLAVSLLAPMPRKPYPLRPSIPTTFLASASSPGISRHLLPGCPNRLERRAFQTFRKRRQRSRPARSAELPAEARPAASICSRTRSSNYSRPHRSRSGRSSKTVSITILPSIARSPRKILKRSKRVRLRSPNAGSRSAEANCPKKMRSNSFRTAENSIKSN